MRPGTPTEAVAYFVKGSRRATPKPVIDRTFNFDDMVDNCTAILPGRTSDANSEKYVVTFKTNARPCVSAL